MGVPYCIVKSKARLGRLVRRKTCTAVALTQVRKVTLFVYNIARSNLQQLTSSCAAKRSINMMNLNRANPMIISMI